MPSTIKRAKCLSGSHSCTDGGRRYAVSRSIVRKLSNGIHPATKKGRINAPILPKPARCAKSDRLLVPRSKLGASNRVQGGEAVCVFPLSPAASLPKLLADWRLEQRASYRPDADVFLLRAPEPLWLVPRWRPQSQNQQERATCSFRPPDALRL